MDPITSASSRAGITTAIVPSNLSERLHVGRKSRDLPEAAMGSE